MISGNTKEYNESLSEEEKLSIIMAAKGGTWYDGWTPYHLPINKPECRNGRMVRMPWGFKCPSCGGEIGFNLHKIEEPTEHESTGV